MQPELGSPSLPNCVCGSPAKIGELSLRRNGATTGKLMINAPINSGSGGKEQRLRSDESDPVEVKTIPLERIDPRFRQLWEQSSPTDRDALSSYFLPHRSRKLILQPSRPRVIKWYCPFAHQTKFPSGLRYCINVYTGCAHSCVYCYAASYEPACARPKRDFGKLLQKDFEDLEEFHVPPAPVHLSNSTDPFQPLELQLGHAKLALEGLLRYRHRFTTVTVLTKNPLLAAQDEYLRLLRRLGEISGNHPARHLWLGDEPHGLQVEVSMSFWREDARAFWDPVAPSLEARIEGMRALHEAGVPVVLRIDPLFPRSPLTTEPHSKLSDFGLEEAHTIEDLEQLVLLAKTIGACHVVYSVVKIVQPRMRSMGRAAAGLRAAFEAMAQPEKLVFRGGSWRLPIRSLALITEPFLDLNST